MEFHEKLQSLAAKEGLKGRKVTRALESFSWNITILKVRQKHVHTRTHAHPKGWAVRTCLAFSYLFFSSNIYSSPSLLGFG